MANFHKKKNEITLIDKVHNYKMLFVVDKKTLIIKQSFSFIINKSFIFNNFITSREPKFLSSNTNALMILKERQSYNKSHKPLFPLYFGGVYGNEQGFKLNFQKNNKYKLEFKNILLSEGGEWCRNHNEIELKDLNLKLFFFLF